MILITGATGTVGSEVVKRLSAYGIQVRVVTRDPRKAEAHRLPHVHFIQGDFEDVESMRRACTGVDRAFLVTNSTEQTEEQQVAFTRVAHESGVRHIVKLSQLQGNVRDTCLCRIGHKHVYLADQIMPRRSYWIPGSWNLRMSYTDELPFSHP